MHHSCPLLIKLICIALFVKKNKSVNDAMIFYKTEIDIFAGEYVGRGTPKHRFIMAFLNNFFSSNTFKV